jgi:hypothetical protein
MIILKDGLEGNFEPGVCDCFCDALLDFQTKRQGFKAGGCACYCGPVGQVDEARNQATEV